MKKSLVPLNEDRLASAVARLCVEEPRFVSVVEAHGVPSLRAMPECLEGLLLIVTEQFISLKAAAAIWVRLHNRLSPFSVSNVLDCSIEDLLGLGLSRAKAKSFHGIARAVESGSLRPEQFHRLEDDEVWAQLLALPGVGPWTAEIYLLAALRRADAWPSGDLALQIAAANLFEMGERLSLDAMTTIGARFSPFRAVVARLLWSHYRSLKGQPQA